MKKNLLFALCALSVASFAATPKNVILFIGDGMSMPQRMIADEFSRKAGLGSLAMNSFPFQAITRTCSANSLVTDSAAAATAIACGEKTNNGAIGVGAKGEKLQSCAEVAKENGRKVGICSSVTLTHATPSGFYGHRSGRGELYGLALDLSRSNFDFFAGGGFEISEKDSTNHAEYAECGDAYKYAEKNGYKIVRTKKEFLELKPCEQKIVTRFTDGALEYAIDVKEDINQPSIAEITSKAIEHLDNEKGFFLMVEGGRIDWAGHGNDAATNLRDVLALEEAVRVALKYQEKNPDTLVIVTGDHETGGMSMGFAGTGYALYMERLANQTMSVGAFESRVKDVIKENPEMTFDEIKPLLKEAFGFEFHNTTKDRKNPMMVSGNDLNDLKKAFSHDIDFCLFEKGEKPEFKGEKKYLLPSACRILISHKSGIAWTSGAHTAMPVLTSAKGPSAEKFVGFIENTDISRLIKSFFAE